MGTKQHCARGYGLYSQELFLTLERYNSFSAVVSFPPRVPIFQQTKLTIAREVQLSHSERRQLRHGRKGIAIKLVMGDRILVRTHRLRSAINRQIHIFFLHCQGSYVVVRVPSIGFYICNSS